MILVTPDADVYALVAVALAVLDLSDDRRFFPNSRWQGRTWNGDSIWLARTRLAAVLVLCLLALANTLGVGA